MNTKKATKRALLTSVMALVMCVVMLVGTTFAWFTDTASTAVNKIQAGNLDIQLVDKEGVELDSATALKWKTVDTGEVLWEPNCKYELEGFQIKNAGNLAVKYKVVLKATDITKTADGKSLLDVIDWTIKLGSENMTVTKEQVKNGLVNGVEILVDKVLAPKELSGVISVTGHMDANAGNDYQGLKIGGFGITVLATQASYEKDSIDETYDAQAEYPTLTKGATLNEVFSDTEFDFGSTSPSANVVLDGQGLVTVTDYVDGWFAGNVTIKGVTFLNGVCFTAKNNNTTGTITFEDCTFYACDQSKIDLTSYQYNSLKNSGDGLCLNVDTKNSPNLKVVVKDCTFIGEDDVTLNRDGWKDIGGENWNAATAVKNKSRGHAIMINGICGGGNNAQAESVLIDGCTMSGIRGHAIQLYQLRMPVTIKDCKINSWGRNAQTAAGSKEDAAIRGDIADATSGTLTLQNNYFGLNEKINNILHVKVNSFSSNTDGSRTAGTY